MKLRLAERPKGKKSGETSMKSEKGRQNRVRNWIRYKYRTEAEELGKARGKDGDG